MPYQIMLSALEEGGLSASQVRHIFLYLLHLSATHHKLIFSLQLYWLVHVCLSGNAFQ